MMIFNLHTRRNKLASEEPSTELYIQYYQSKLHYVLIGMSGVEQ